MKIYLYIVAAVLIFGVLLPQKGPKRKYYVILMTAIHTFVCAFRYEHLTGDLLKYNWEFSQMATYGWFSQEVLQDGRNTGFYMLLKLVNELTGENFQALLIVIAVITHVILAYVIYRYSTAPWLSFLVWDCMGLYIFGFNAIKQALAMSFLMLAFIGITKRKLSFYLIMVAIASAIHMPALIFLPAYWLTSMRVNKNTVLFYLLLGLALFVFKNQFVSLIRLIYYETDEELMYSGEVGGRFIMVLGFTLFGLLFAGMRDGDMEKLFHLMAVATILQLLSGYDNIFTRLTDYYFQFSVLYMPMVFFPKETNPGRLSLRAVFPFNNRSLKLLSMIVALYMFWFYYVFNLNSGVAVTGTSYLNFQFMWEVP